MDWTIEKRDKRVKRKISRLARFEDSTELLTMSKFPAWGLNRPAEIVQKSQCSVRRNTFQPTVLVSVDPSSKHTLRRRRFDKLSINSKSYKASEMDKLDALSEFRRQVFQRPHYNSPDKKSFKKGDLRSALTRLRKAAEGGLESSRYALDFRGFEGKPLSPQEFERMLKISFDVKLSKNELQEVVKFFDINGDGLISLDEVLDKMLHPQTLSVEEAKFGKSTPVLRWNRAMELLTECVKAHKGKNDSAYLLEVFNKADENGDGEISLEEFTKLLRALGLKLNEWEFEDIFRMFDPDRTGLINYNEFITAYFNKREYAAAIRRKTEKRSRPPFKA